MSVTLLLGAPGYGKSTYLASIVKKSKKKGLNIYSNVYIEGAKMLDLKNDLNFYRMENGIVLVDEAGAEWDNRDWKNFSDRNKRFFQMHRHYNLDIVVSCQNYEDVDAKIKRLTTRILVCKKSILYPYLIKVKSITQDVDISEDKSAIIAVFEWKLFFLGNRYIYAPMYWKLFDSYFQDKLNDKDWKTWSKENKEFYIKDYTTPPVKKLS